MYSTPPPPPPLYQSCAGLVVEGAWGYCHYLFIQAVQARKCTIPEWIVWLTLNCLNKWKLNLYFLYYTGKLSRTIKLPSQLFPGCLHLLQMSEWHFSWIFCFSLLLWFLLILLGFVYFTKVFCMLKMIRNDLGCLFLWGLCTAQAGTELMHSACSEPVLQSTWSQGSGTAKLAISSPI